jgi:hypothetical protein
MATIPEFLDGIGSNLEKVIGGGQRIRSIESVQALAGSQN